MRESDCVFLVGKLVDGGPWEVQGIFTRRADARDYATANGFFLMYVEKNKRLPNETVDGTDCAYWPHCELPSVGMQKRYGIDATGAFIE